MAEQYRKNPSYAHSAMGGSHKQSIEQHCDALAAMYTKSAEEAEQLAQEHRDLSKK
jgi:DNA-binding GntR family transcriptional regulator